MTPKLPVLALVAVLLSVSAARAPDAVSALGEARKLLDAAKPDDALVKAEEGLEYDADSFELFDLASRAAQAAGAADKALWYTALALEAVPKNLPKDRAKLVDEARARLASLDPLQGQASTARDAYNAALVALGNDAAKRKSWVSAAALLGRARGEAPEKALAKIYDDKKAVEALLDSGADVPVRTKKKRTQKDIAKLDAAHATWDKAHEIKGAQYTIRTDMGIELAEAFSTAMEQMNRFYRKVFGVKERGGETARVTMKIYRSRAEFDAHEKEMNDQGELVPLGKTTKGFFSQSKLEVCTYDGREEGFSLADLWSTLFHEASHQFTAIALPAGAEPIWLNEGTASYFEGARLLPNGTVEANRVAERRLEQLVAMLEQQTLNLTQVVTCPDGDTYDGRYYPWGFGVVYFFYNYEDDACRRVYVHPYRDYMQSYKSGAEHDVKARFIEYFVTKPKLSGVASFEDFEKRWSTWIKELGRIHFGGQEVADELIARARKQKTAKQDEAAVETYSWALRKRPGDAVALHELGEILAAKKKNDAAAWTFRQAYETLRAVADPSEKVPSSNDLTAKDLSDASLGRLVKLDKGLHDGLLAADQKFETVLVDAGKAYADAKLPLYALAFMDGSRATFGRSAKVDAARAALVAGTGADPRRWRRLSVTKDLDAWSGRDAWSSSGETIVATGAEGAMFLDYSGAMPSEYRYEAVLDGSALDKKNGFAGLVFGNGDAGLRFLGVFGAGNALLGELEEGLKPKKPLAGVKADKLGELAIAIEVRANEVECFLDGKSAGKVALTADELAGGIGLVAQGGTAKFSSLRLRY